MKKNYTQYTIYSLGEWSIREGVREPSVYTSSFGTKNEYSRFIRNNEAKNGTMFTSKNVFFGTNGKALNIIIQRPT